MSRTISITITAIACLLGAYFGHQLGRRSVAIIPADAVEERQVEAVEREKKLEPAVLVRELVSAAEVRDREVADAAAERFKVLDRAGVEEALAAALEIRGFEEKRGAIYLALGRLAELDPDAAIKFLAEQIPESERHDYAYPVFITIANEVGGQAAFDLYNKHINVLGGQVGISSLFPIFHEWRKQDLDAALAASAQIDGKGQRRQVISTLCEAAGDEANRDRVLVWARGLADDEERLAAIGDVAGIWAGKESPDVVLTWVDETDLSTPEIDAVERQIAEVRLRDDPVAAADWLMSRADETSHSEHLAHIVEQWAMRQPNAAGKWLAGQELDARADLAIYRFSHAVVRDDPESAYEWAQQIGDDKMRHSAIQNVMRYWERFDPVAAKKARGE